MRIMKSKFFDVYILVNVSPVTQTVGFIVFSLTRNIPRGKKTTLISQQIRINVKKRFTPDGEKVFNFQTWCVLQEIELLTTALETLLGIKSYNFSVIIFFNVIPVVIIVQWLSRCKHLSVYQLQKMRGLTLNKKSICCTGVPVILAISSDYSARRTVDHNGL